MEKTIAILGSTGSIGTQTLEVVRENQDIRVAGLSAGSNITLLEKQIREFHPSLAFSSSRSSMLGLIEGGKVFVNGKMVVSNGHPLKPEDIVSVRGYGKFRYDGMAGTTKKGRCSVTVQKYI